MLETLRQRNFALLWFGGLISFAGDWALIIALPVFIYDLTGSTLATGAMFIAQTLPRLLFGPLAGVFVDRWNRKHTLVVANLAQGAVLPLLLLVQSTDLLWLLYLVAFIQTSISLVNDSDERRRHVVPGLRPAVSDAAARPRDRSTQLSSDPYRRRHRPGLMAYRGKCHA